MAAAVEGGGAGTGGKGAVVEGGRQGGRQGGREGGRENEVFKSAK